MIVSFSGKVKNELLGILPARQHCCEAELAALLCGLYRPDRKPSAGDGGVSLPLSLENEGLTRKLMTLMERISAAHAGGPQDAVARGGFLCENGVIRAREGTDSWETLLGALGMNAALGTPSALSGEVPGALLRRGCCRRAFLRGMFLACGSMSDPGREYHLEFVCSTQQQGAQVLRTLQKENLTGRMVPRRKYFVVYLKEAEEIISLLSLMGAHSALMEMENSRILKDIANDVNRRVNFETSNLMKTATAAEHQAEDIRYIEQHGGFGRLPEGLRAVAELRLSHPDATLKELGELCDPPVGKSGVNHRLRRLSQIAAAMQNHEK